MLVQHQRDYHEECMVDHPAFLDVGGINYSFFSLFLGYAAKVLMDEDVSSPEEIEEPLYHKTESISSVIIYPKIYLFCPIIASINDWVLASSSKFYRAPFRDINGVGNWRPFFRKLQRIATRVSG